MNGMDEIQRDSLLRHVVRTRAHLPPPALSLVVRRAVLRDLADELRLSLERSLAAQPGTTAAEVLTAWAMTERQPAFTFTSPLATHPLGLTTVGDAGEQLLLAFTTARAGDGRQCASAHERGGRAGAGAQRHHRERGTAARAVARKRCRAPLADG